MDVFHGMLKVFGGGAGVLVEVAIVPEADEEERITHHVSQHVEDAGWLEV